MSSGGRRDDAKRAVRPGLASVARATMLLAWAIGPLSARCQIYMGTSEQSGAIVLSSFASDEAHQLITPAAAGSASDTLPPTGPTRLGRVPARTLPAELLRIIDTAASRSSVSPELIRAVMEAESHFEPAAVSSRGAIGLMQLLPGTARRFGALDPFDPAQNVTAGAAYLRWLMDYFDDDLELVLAGYNAGEQAVVRAGRKIPPYPETQTYVKKVIAWLQRPTPGPL